MSLLSRIFGSSNQRYLNKISKIVKVINGLEKQYQDISDNNFKNLAQELSTTHSQDLFLLTAHAFAAVREASVRTLGLRHFDSQMLGGIALSEGNISEMKTGEGKTLVATLPAYLNYIKSNKVVLVTVNDYLARRDSEWMKPIYDFLGMKTGVIFSNQEIEDKKNAYESDVIYATNNELGFDYLRDNMALRNEDKVQCSLDFAIVDEVDSILIDEARTPLIISGPSNESPEHYLKLKKIIPSLTQQTREESEEKPLEDHERGDYIIDEKSRSIDLTDDGYIKVEGYLEESGLIEPGENLYTSSNLKIMRYVQATLRANLVFKKNIDYIVQNNEVLLIDEHTGRAMTGRRVSEGVHQALEAKENVPVQRESQTLASTTFQNFFRLFNSLSGMTGTADTEAREFKEIYGLDVVIIPTHMPMIRGDQNDLVFLTKKAKFKALIEETEELRSKNAPILIGTTSVESSEIVSSLLSEKNIPHQVLNAKHHEKEAEIIANAGSPGVVTIATNMAGRGTDIVLGGKNDNTEDKAWSEKNTTVLKAGGLHILGTERHESRRIDNQLRGRAGRQGDPGYSKFFLSLEDDLLRLFISDSRRALFERIGMGDDHIEHRMLSRGIENAQKRIENRNFDLRKNLLEYDDVANDQRQAIYSLRDQLLEEEDISTNIDEIITEEFTAITYDSIPIDSIESQWKVQDLEKYLADIFKIEMDIQSPLKTNKRMLPKDVAKMVVDEAENAYEKKYSHMGGNKKILERQVMLQVLDNHWKNHLSEMDSLRQNIGLRAYAQKNPKNEYKREAYEMFEVMLNTINLETIKVLFNLELVSEDEIKELEAQALEEQKKQKIKLSKPQQNPVDELDNAAPIRQPQNQMTPSQVTRGQPKIGRNEPCFCGSGKKYKQCHGK
tara:strand:- start:2262 stop:4949 length:2688 start_codon:yes stop_codon:yes gene_type:complete